ncbi:MAG: glycosyltransferase, partial [Lachnospiraceae bacterium]|nr:glycosyltransferase [Lachnospiraceae bacterium]
LTAVEEEGYDCASARRVSRKGEPKFRSFFSKAFYYIINRVTAIDLVPGSTDYRLMKRSVVKAIVSMTERERFTKGIYSWIGFKNKWIEYENVERAFGKTKWSLGGLFRYAYSGFIAFATTPLRGVVYLGMLIVVVSVIYAIIIFIGALQSPESRTGYSSIMLTLLLLGGVIITLLGIIGEYLARIYMEVKKRPLYFERESNIDDDSFKET